MAHGAILLCRLTECSDKCWLPDGDPAQMPQIKPALYYPYVHIRSEQWLKATLLCVPAVTRLVPEGYKPEDDIHILPYTEIEGPYGTLLQAIPSYSAAAVMAQERLLEKIEQNFPEIKARFNREKAPSPDEYWIHDAKFSSDLLAYLESNDLAWRSQDPNAYGQRGWYALHPTLGKAVMTCIGLGAARERGLDIVTADGKFHEALLTTREGDVFETLLHPEGTFSPAANETRRDLGQLVIALAGVNLQALSVDRIPELQQSEKFRAFRETLRESASTIDNDVSEEVYREQLDFEAEKIVDAWRDAVNDTSKDLRKLVFESMALGVEAVKTLVRGPEALELCIVGGLGVWRIKEEARSYLRSRQKSMNFLSQVHDAQSEVLRLQYPLGLERGD
jgi:hypothetical protein